MLLKLQCFSAGIKQCENFAVDWKYLKSKYLGWVICEESLLKNLFYSE